MRLGMVFQDFELIEYLDVIDNVLLPYRISPVLTLNAQVRERAKSLVQEVGLGDKQRRYPGHLSQGERQRIAVCRALVTRPAIVLGDEPTGNLDPENRDHIMDTLWRYCDESLCCQFACGAARSRRSERRVGPLGVLRACSPRKSCSSFSQAL